MTGMRVRRTLSTTLGLDVIAQLQRGHELLRNYKEKGGITKSHTLDQRRGK